MLTKISAQLLDLLPLMFANISDLGIHQSATQAVPMLFPTQCLVHALAVATKIQAQEFGAEQLVKLITIPKLGGSPKAENLPDLIVKRRRKNRQKKCQ